MLEHIVKNNESVKDILNLYKIDMDELVSYNLHLTDFSNLVCGTKIRIPLINKEVEQVLSTTESFVNDYYPVVDEVSVKNNEVESIDNNDNNNIKYRGIPYPGIIPRKLNK